jgi:protein-tyrosine phosphatase
MWSRLSQWIQELFNPVQNNSVHLREKAMVKVLFVCMGNVCRSPMAEGMFRRLLQDASLVEQVYVDSAGTHSYHIGARPDTRTQLIAARRGVDLSSIRVRRVAAEDLAEFDYILAMDRDNYVFLHALCSQTEQRGKIRLLMEFAPDLMVEEVPDPFYGSIGGFERVVDLLEAATQGLLSHIRERHGL